MEYKAVDKKTGNVEYTIRAISRAVAKLYMRDIDPENEEFYITEGREAESYKKKIKAKAIKKERGNADDGFIKEQKRQAKLCST